MCYLIQLQVASLGKPTRCLASKKQKSKSFMLKSKNPSTTGVIIKRDPFRSLFITTVNAPPPLHKLTLFIATVS